MLFCSFLLHDNIVLIGNCINVIEGLMEDWLVQMSLPSLNKEEERRRKEKKICWWWKFFLKRAMQEKTHKQKNMRCVLIVPSAYGYFACFMSIIFHKKISNKRSIQYYAFTYMICCPVSNVKICFDYVCQYYCVCLCIFCRHKPTGCALSNMCIKFIPVKTVKWNCYKTGFDSLTRLFSDLKS